LRTGWIDAKTADQVGEGGETQEAAQPMQFNAREVIEAPIEFVFQSACQFQRFAQAARKNGAQVRRQEPEPESGRGLRWDVQYPFRGAVRNFTIELTEKIRPDALHFAIRSRPVEGVLAVEFKSLEPERTQVEVTLVIEPKTLKSKVIFQSAQLGKTAINQRFAAQVEAHARRAESHWQERRNAH
jgi:hypothetical protein